MQTKTITLQTPAGDTLKATDDPGSDRVRCDHPDTERPGALARRLGEVAEARGRGRVVALVEREHQRVFAASGYHTEAVMPGFYEGSRDCVVMGRYLRPERGVLANPVEVSRVKSLLARKPRGVVRARVATRRAVVEDAPAIAALLGETFEEYPTPSDDPAYIVKQLRDGVPFRVYEQEGEVVACASADLVREAKTAELTDCATRPEARGKGVMQSLLLALMEDLRAMGYPTAFTLARARIPGINLAFHRLGFRLRGCMPRSCQIGDGLEDMNVWSRSLA